MKPPTELAEAFRANGLKVTPQRQLLFRLLDGNDQHPTAEWLHTSATAVLPGISLRTVYSTLTDLAEMGEIRPLTLGGGASRFDPNTDEHHHLVCDDCGAIGDVYVEGADTLSASGLEMFTTTGASIVFHGSCTDCKTT